MKTLAFYPGSFNPFHKGHLDIVNQVLPLVDRLFICAGTNRDKPLSKASFLLLNKVYVDNKKIIPVTFEGLFKDFVERTLVEFPEHEAFVVKGLRNSSDFIYEQQMQYWNEDLGIGIPTFYAISNRSLVHISSTAIRQIENRAS